MKICPLLLVLSSVLLLGCNEKGTNDIPVAYDSMLQFDVGSGETPEAVHSDDGNIHVAATCYIPVPSKNDSPTEHA